MSRSLYDCAMAMVCHDRILCYRGYKLDPRANDGGIATLRLERGEPLNFAVCHGCAEFESMGAPVPKEERGWLKLYKGGKYTGVTA